MTTPSLEHNDSGANSERWLCHACEYANRANAHFCGRCGRPAGIVCQQCGTDNPGGHQFCDVCGVPLYEEASPASSRPAASAPSPGTRGPGFYSRLRHRLPNLQRMVPRQGLVWHTPHPDWQWSRQFLKEWTARNRWELIAVVLLTLVGAFLRIYRLEEIPAGFHGDEAWTGIEGLRILEEGWIGPYTTSALGQATGPFYLTALVFWLLDASKVTVRLSMGLFGIATIPAAHLLLRLGFGRWVALFGTTALTVSYWHLHFSRLGFGLISLAFVGVLAATSLLWAMRSGRRWSWLLAGACLGLLPYTYFAFPAFMAAEATLLAYYFLLHRELLRSKLIYLALFAAGFLIIAWPVVDLALDSPHIYFGRMLGVSVNRYQAVSEADGSGEKASFLGKRALYALKFLYTNPRRDGADGTGGAGVLDFGTAALAYLGLFVSIKRWRSPPHLFAALAVSFALLTLVVTDPSSGGMRRSINAIPWVFGLAGIGAMFIADGLGRHLGQWRRIVVTASAVAVLLVGGLWNLNYYFVELPKSSTFQFTFPTYYFEALDAANSFQEPGLIYYFSDRRGFRYETIRFLYPESRGIDRSWEFGAFNLEKLDTGPVTYLLEGSYMDEIDKVMEMYPGGGLIVDDRPQPLYIVYHLKG